MPSYSMQLYGTKTYLFTQHIQQAQESSSSISNRQGRVLALRRSQSPLGLPLGRSQSSLGAPLWNNLHITIRLGRRVVNNQCPCWPGVIRPFLVVPVVVQSMRNSIQQPCHALIHHLQQPLPEFMMMLSSPCFEDSCFLALI